MQAIWSSYLGRVRLKGAGGDRSECGKSEVSYTRWVEAMFYIVTRVMIVGSRDKMKTAKLVIIDSFIQNIEDDVTEYMMRLLLRKPGPR